MLDNDHHNLAQNQQCFDLYRPLTLQQSNLAWLRYIALLQADHHQHSQSFLARLLRDNGVKNPVLNGPSPHTRKNLREDDSGPLHHLRFQQTFDMQSRDVPHLQTFPKQYVAVQA